MNAKLHYVYDPLCGWCYGAEPLVRAAEGVAGLELELHAGGLFPRPTRLAPEMRRYVQQADRRVGEISGQPYGDAYLNGLLLDPTLVLDSPPVIAAVLAAESMDPGKTVEMLRGIQHAHWEHGRRVVERGTLVDIAAQCGLDREEFAAALDTVPVDAHIATTQQLMSRIGAAGFPTFVLEVAGRWLPVPHQRFASSAGDFARWLAQQVAAAGPSTH